MWEVTKERGNYRSKSLEVVQSIALPTTFAFITASPLRTKALRST
jgi:hypothetical protein